MSAAQLLGLAIIAGPFVALFVWVCIEDGIGSAVGIFAFTAALIAFLGLGTFLAVGHL